MNTLGFLLYFNGAILTILSFACFIFCLASGLFLYAVGAFIFINIFVYLAKIGLELC